MLLRLSWLRFLTYKMEIILPMQRVLRVVLRKYNVLVIMPYSRLTVGSQKITMVFIIAITTQIVLSTIQMNYWT